MKKRLAIVVSASALALAVIAGPAMAAPGGMPAAHGFTPGSAWGQAVAGLATSGPGAVAAHIAAAHGE